MNTGKRETPAPQRVVILSAFQDYRSKKRASIQQVADGLVRLGHEVTFISTRFSHLSKRTGDSRLFLWDRANRFERINGINCYLWKTAAHPFASGVLPLNMVMNLFYPLYAGLRNSDVDRVFSDADAIIVESSVAAISLRRIHRLNPRAKLIYYATDRLETVGAHSFVQKRLIEDAPLISHVSVRSPKMTDDFPWAADRTYLAEFGINQDDFNNIGPNPYGEKLAAVSVGSMLFDPTFFQAIATQFSNVEFHVIGCGTTFDAPANVIVHTEMPFRDTLPYVKHAAVGLAPYRSAPGVEYLADSSLKLAQYELLGLPAVCPRFAQGNIPSRCGYIPGDPGSMATAMSNALDMRGKVVPRHFASWDQVADQVLNPERHPTLKIAH